MQDVVLKFTEYTGEPGTRPPFCVIWRDAEELAAKTHPLDGDDFTFLFVPAGKKDPIDSFFVCYRASGEGYPEGFEWTSVYANYADGDYSEDEINSIAEGAYVAGDGRLNIPLRKGDQWAVMPFWGQGNLLMQGAKSAEGV